MTPSRWTARRHDTTSTLGTRGAIDGDGDSTVPYAYGETIGIVENLRVP
jgi:hypothetical protein